MPRLGTSSSACIIPSMMSPPVAAFFVSAEVSTFAIRTTYRQSRTDRPQSHL